MRHCEQSGFGFVVKGLEPDTQARAGVFTTPHGEVNTPMFMPVGTAATVKGIKPSELVNMGAGVVLANTYHLFLRPGHALIRGLGGLHRFMGWDGPLLTDSGGFQVFSQSDLCKVSEEGVEFKSYLDGSQHWMGPEESIAVQEALGADVIMAFDQCAALPATTRVLEEALQRTTRWLRRCIDARTETPQALFGILQGGTDVHLRRRHLEEIVPFDLPGYAIGGLSVGEPPEEMHRVVAEVAPEMPADRPRYLMGVGRPEDLVESVHAGVDMFDCVMPTRNARNAYLFTHQGGLRIRNARFKDDPDPAKTSFLTASRSN